MPDDQLDDTAMVVPLSPRTGLPLIPKTPPGGSQRCREPMPELLKRGIEQFNAGEYWECHETIEELWRGEPDPVRGFYQGVLLVAVGCLHVTRGNRRGAVSKMSSGLRILPHYTPSCHGVDVSALIMAATSLLGTVQSAETLNPAAIDATLWPRIRLIQQGA